MRNKFFSFSDCRRRSRLGRDDSHAAILPWTVSREDDSMLGRLTVRRRSPLELAAVLLQDQGRRGSQRSGRGGWRLFFSRCACCRGGIRAESDCDRAVAVKIADFKRFGAIIDRAEFVRVRSSGDDPCCPTAADALDAAVNSCPERAPHGLRNRAGVP